MMESWTRWCRRHVFIVDSIWAFALLVFCLFIDIHYVSFAVISISIGLILPLAWRRTYPIASGFFVAAAAVLHLIMIEDSVLSAGFAVPCALYAMAAYGAIWGSRIGLIVALVGALSCNWRYAPDGVSAQGLLVTEFFTFTFILGVWAFGMLRRIRLKQVDSLVERANFLERERERAAELAALTERNRIAREMHDIIAHSLAVVVAQADGGRYVAAENPRAAQDALGNIAVTGRQALADMRSLLAVLKEGADCEFSSTSGVSGIVDLVEKMRSSGLNISYDVIGKPRQLSAGVELSIFRIVQESLTNILKHAGSDAFSWIQLCWNADHLVIEIRNSISRSQNAIAFIPSGRGLSGMRERVELHGGTLQVGPSLAGFAVSAYLPYGQS
ncbi:MAG: sensor histidine kinase [Mycobacteriaceae bacterium]